MFDGIKLSYTFSDFRTWNPPISFNTLVDIETGSIKLRTIQNGINRTNVDKKYGYYGHYGLSLVTVKRNNPERAHYHLNVNGSLHKNFFNGANVEFFNKDLMIQEVNNLAYGCMLEKDLTRIKGIELGINLPIVFDAMPFLQRTLLSFKGIPFNRYEPDDKGKCIGYYVKLSQYSIKIYDKSLQYGLPYPLLRFEIKYHKMQPVHSVIGYKLSDLLLVDKLKLQAIMLKMWDSVLINEFSEHESIELLPRAVQECLNTNYMMNLKQVNPRKYRRILNGYKKEVSKLNKTLHNYIREEIIKQTNRW